MLSRLGSPLYGLRHLRRGVLRRRRLLAFVLTMMAVAVGLHAARAPATPTVTLVVAAHDLPAGSVLGSSDLTTVAVPPGDVPDGAEAEPVGATLAAPVRRGEPVTDARLVGPSLTATAPGLIALPVRFSDAAMAGLLQVGDRLRLLATSPTSGQTSTVADGVRVLALPAVAQQTLGESGVTSGLDGRLVIVGVTEDLVTPVTSAGVRGFLTFAWTH